MVSKSDRVVRREVCSIVTKGQFTYTGPENALDLNCCLKLSGTRTLNFLNGDASGGESVFLLAVKEMPMSEGTWCRQFGVCFVDTCIGTIHASCLASC